MISLVKNELTKIFHKKAIYILAIVTLLFTILTGVILKFASNIDNIFLDNGYIDFLEENLKNYDLNDPEQLRIYVDDKTDVEISKLLKNYDDDSWQAYQISYAGYDYLHAVNEAKYITKDDSLIEEAQKKYDEFISEINDHDWQYFVNKDLDTYKEQKKMLEEQLNDEELTENDKVTINNEIESINYKIEGAEYRLKLGIPNDTSSNSLLVEQYVDSALAYQNMNKDESKINDYDELTAKRETEENLYVSKYKLDNNIQAVDSFGASELILMDTVAPVLFVIVSVIMIAGSIVAEEFNKGTIKQLLLRPYKRWKILLSKYIASIIVFCLFLLFYELMSYVTYGVILGFETYNIPIVLYNFNTHEAFQVSLATNILINLLSILPAYLIILTIAFFVGILTTNSAVSIAVGFLVFFFGNIINQMATLINSKLVAFIPSMCWNFNSYLFGGLPPYKHSSLGISIMVSVVVFLIFLVGSFIAFKKKDIKNQ